MGQGYDIPAVALQVPVNRGPMEIVDDRLVHMAHKEGLQVHAWTINDAKEMDRLLDLGVDGIVTDRIDLLNDVLAARKKAGREAGRVVF